LRHHVLPTPSSGADAPRESTEIDLSQASVPSCADAVGRNLLVPPLEQVISRLLVAPEKQTVLQKLLSDIGLSIEERSELVKFLSVPGRGSRPMVNPHLWIPQFDPHESAYDAATRHRARLIHEDSEAMRHIVELSEAMDPECRLTICIPVAMEERVEVFARTLRHFYHQTCASNRYEIVCLLNKPERFEGSHELSKADFDASCKPFFEAIDAARDVGIRVHACAMEAPTELLYIGHIRGVLHSIAIERYRQRGEGYPDHLLMRADADMDFIEPTCIDELLNQAERQPGVVNFWGRLRATPDALIEDPMLLFGYDLYFYLNDLRIQGGKIPCGGPHATTWLTTYVQSGGFESLVSCGEDVLLDQLLVGLAEKHQERTPYVFLGRESTIYTNTRRAEVAVRLGLSPAVQWDARVARFSALNPEIRSAERRAHGSFEELIQDPLLRLEVEDWIQQSVTIFFQREALQQQPVMQRMAETLSAHYGLQLSVSVALPSIYQHALEYRICVDDLGTLPDWLRREQRALIDEQARMRKSAPSYMPEQRTRAAGLKYDEPDYRV
jgi:hypothetical protein